MDRLKILFVEDLPADVEIACRELVKEAVSFTHRIVSTADEFKETLEEFGPDLIISDYSMPGFDGLDALKITRSLPVYIPFIMLTGSMNEETAVACLKTGADDYVIKEKIRRLPFAVRDVLKVNQLKQEKEQSQQQLLESEETYRNLFQNAQVGLFRTRISDGKILECNEQIAKMFGYDNREEFVAEYVTSQNYADPGIREKMLDEIRKDGSVQNFEARFFKKDRTVFWVCYSAKIYYDKGWIEGVAEDITKRKQAQEKLMESDRKLQKLSAQVLGMIYQFRRSPDGTYCIPYSSEGIRDIFGCSPEEVKDGFSPIATVIHPEDLNEVIRSIEQSAADLTLWQCEYRVQLPGKEIHWMLGRSMPERLADGSILWHGYNTDITKRKQAEQELVRAKERAEESDRLKSAFLANMSHEIRTPMNGILGFTELLKEPGLTGEEQQKFIEIIQRSGNRLLSTVNDLIDISRIETGQMPSVYTSTNVNELMESLMTFFKPQTQQKGLLISLNKLLPDPVAIIRTDQAKLDSVLTNLLKNAIKYTETGEINTGCIHQGDHLEFYVRDTGIGVPLNRREAIFNRFEQADIGDTRAFQGSGLGLSIAKAYVEMLGGTIWVESAEGSGSTFFFTLPIAKEEVLQPQDQPSSGGKESGLKIQGEKLKILIAEDDESSYLFLTAALKEVASTILQATTGTESIELCRSNPDIDLILMDIKMPLMDGYEATRKIREFNKEVVIIAQTAYALAGDKEKSFAAGCTGYVAKPVGKDKLVELIRTHLSGRS